MGDQGALLHNELFAGHSDALGKGSASWPSAGRRAGGVELDDVFERPLSLAIMNKCRVS